MPYYCKFLLQHWDQKKLLLQNWKKYTLFFLTVHPVLPIRGYTKITLHNEGREIRETASETLKAADGVVKTPLLELVQCRHAKSSQNQRSKSSISLFFSTMLHCLRQATCSVVSSPTTLFSCYLWTLKQIPTVAEKLMLNCNICLSMFPMKC